MNIISNPLYVIINWKATEATSKVPQKKRVHNHREEIDRRRSISRNSTGTWMHSWVLHILGLPQKSQNRLQGYLGRKITTRTSSYLRWKVQENSGKMTVHDDFKKATRTLAAVGHQVEWEMPISHQVAGSDRGRLTSSHVSNFEGNVDIIKKFMDRRRQHRPRQSGGDTQQWQDRLQWKEPKDWHGWEYEYRFLEPPTHFANVFPSQPFVFLDFAHRHERPSCTRRGVKSEHVTVRSTDAHFSHHVSCCNNDFHWLTMSCMFQSASFSTSHSHRNLFVCDNLAILIYWWRN